MTAFGSKKSQKNKTNKLFPLFLDPYRKSLAEKYIMTAAKLIAPSIETSFATGFDWSVAGS